MAEEKKINKNNVANNQNATSFRDKKNSSRPTNNNRLLYDPEYRQHNFLNSNIAREDDEEQEESSEEEEKETEEKQDNEQEENNEEQKSKENTNSPKVEGTIREKLRVKGKTKMHKGTFILKFQKFKIIIIIGAIALLLLFVLILFGAIGDEESDDNYNSYCATGTGGNLLSFLESWEGNEGYCDVNGEKGYTAKNLGDGAITLGSGFTNLAMDNDVVNYIQENGWSEYFPGNTVTEGMCVPIPVFERVQLFAIEKTYAKAIDDAASKYNVVLTQYQKDALTDFNYNQGTAYSDSLLSAYASGGYSGLWNEMKIHTKGGMAGIKKRLKAEFALFVTGDYSDQNLFYSRSITNFDDYNSEGVLSRRLVCTGNVSTKNYTKSTSNGLNDVLTKQLKDALLEHHTNYKQFNESILSSVIKAGVGTRDGVVAAAVSLVAGLYENYQIRIPYTYGGQHGYALSTAASPLGSSFYGADPTWGKYIGNFYLGGYGPYHYYGPDCSGFVMWSLHNGGMKAYPGISTNYASLGRNITLNGKRVGDPGDLMVHPGHIMLIVGVDDEQKVYYIAHAAGGQQGVKINSVDFTDSYNQVVKMDNFYANADNREYTNSTDFANAFRAGEL